MCACMSMMDIHVGIQCVLIKVANDKHVPSASFLG